MKGCDWMGYYHVAQICLNGHVITDTYDSNPEFRKNFCTQCGAKTIVSCQSCNTHIHGDYECEGITFLSSTMNTAPSYCHNCGIPYPWTEEKLLIANEMLALDSSLSDDDRNNISKNIGYLVSDTPRTQLAAMKIKSLLSKVGKGTAAAFRDIIVDISSETAKKILWPS